MKNIINKLPAQPEAKIIIDGLFILCVNEDKRIAEIGICEFANEHELFARVSKKEHGVSSELLKGGKLIRKLDDKHEIKAGNISISIPGKQANLTAYNHSTLTDDMVRLADPRQTSSDIEKNKDVYSKDFRWIIDLEGPKFHKQKLEVVPGVIQRKIHIPHGVLYTERWNRREVKMAYEDAALKKLAVENLDLPADKQKLPREKQYCYVTGQLGIAIEKIGKEELLNISYGGESAPQILSLSKPEKGTYYEILISNNCLVKDVDKKNRQSDFQYYYSAINMHIADRLELVQADGQGNDRLPCDLIFLGETPELP